MTGLDFLHSQTNLSSYYLKQDNDTVLVLKVATLAMGD